MVTVIKIKSFVPWYIIKHNENHNSILISGDFLIID